MRFSILLITCLVLFPALARADFYATGQREIKGQVMNDMLTEKLSIIINYGSFSMGDDAMQSMPVHGATPAVQAQLEQLANGEHEFPPVVIVKGTVSADRTMQVDQIVDPSSAPVKPSGWQALAQAQNLLIEAYEDGPRTPAGLAKLEQCRLAANDLHRDAREPELVRKAAEALVRRAKMLILN